MHAYLAFSWCYKAWHGFGKGHHPIRFLLAKATTIFPHIFSPHHGVFKQPYQWLSVAVMGEKWGPVAVVLSIIIYHYTSLIQQHSGDKTCHKAFQMRACIQTDGWTGIL